MNSKSGSGRVVRRVMLTAATIDALKPSADPYRITDLAVAGLGVRVSPTGIKSWDLAFRISGQNKTRRLSLGRTNDVTLRNARERAQDILSAARSGKDLAEEESVQRHAQQMRVTVSEIIERYVDRRLSGRLKTAKEIERRLLRSLNPVLGWKLADLRRRDLRELLDAVAYSGRTREAEQRRQTIGAMLRWAASQDYIDTDPSHGLACFDSGTPRTRTLSDEEIRSLWLWLDQPELKSHPATILKLQLLTGARCGELGGMNIDEIDTILWLWTLPATRSKNGQARVTPLVGMARQIVERQLGLTTGAALFTTCTKTPLNSSDVGSFLLNRARSLPIAKFTSHDLRRSVATRLVDLGHPLDLIASLLGHQAGGSHLRTLVRHYVHTQQIERKTQLLCVWDEHVRKVVAPRAIDFESNQLAI